MPSVKTEERHDKAIGLDVAHPAMALRLLASGQQVAAKAVDGAIESIAAAAEIAAEVLSSGGKLAYAGAGSSGLMAMADALELPGTYGIAHDKIVVLLAGGAASLTDLAGGYEDDIELARDDVRQAGIGKGDCLVAVSASGSTPYALAALDEALSRGARVIGMANKSGCGAVQGCRGLDPPADAAGSRFRLDAHGARARRRRSPSICFRRWSAFSSAMSMTATWSTSRLTTSSCAGRAVRIVSDIAGIGPTEAGHHLNTASGSVKIAILLAAGAGTVATAEAALVAARQNLRKALSSLASQG